MTTPPLVTRDGLAAVVCPWTCPTGIDHTWSTKTAQCLMVADALLAAGVVHAAQHAIFDAVEAELAQIEAVGRAVANDMVGRKWVTGRIRGALDAAKAASARTAYLVQLRSITTDPVLLDRIDALEASENGE